MIFKFSGLKGNLVVIFPLSRLEIAELPTSILLHRRYRVIVILELILYQVNGYISLLVKTNRVIFIADKRFWVFALRHSGLDLISSMRLLGRKDSRSVKSASYIHLSNTHKHTHTHIEQLQSAYQVSNLKTFFIQWVVNEIPFSSAVVAA